MAETEAAAVKRLGALLNGIAQNMFFKQVDITAELLKEQLYSELPLGEFTALHDKMKGLLKSVASADMDGAQLEAFLSAQSRKQGGGGGVTAEQAAALSRFWKSGRGRVREVLVAQSCWEPALRGVSWRVDLQSASSRCVDGRDDNQSGPVALVELEVGRIGEDSEFVCLEFDEAGVERILKKMSSIQESIDMMAEQS